MLVAEVVGGLFLHLDLGGDPVLGQISPRFVSLGLLLVSVTHAPWRCLQGIARGEMIGEGAGWGGKNGETGI